MKMRKIEEDLKTEYYKIIEDKEPVDQPSVAKPKPPPTLSKKFQEEIEAELKDHALKQEEMKRESERLEREMNQEASIQLQELLDYTRRESGDGGEKAQGIIPSAISPGNSPR
jgi:hypothetical protein